MRAADGKAVANIAKVLADGRYGNSPPHLRRWPVMLAR
jgi:hypothetical protein